MSPALVPAWRRLGLQLKNEQAGLTPVDQSLSNGHSPNADKTHDSKKRKRSSLDEREVKSLKPAIAPHLNGVSATSGLGTPKRKAIEHFSETPSPRKHKSVSFTPDTKEEDGGRDMSEFYDGSDSDDSDNEPISPPQVRVHEQSPKPSITPTEPISTAEDQVKKIKKPKKPKSAKAVSANGTEPEHIPPQLQYLREYESSRATWKFNKAKQNWLLKHALDLEKIPSEYDAALVAYMNGLDNDTARSRLHSAAKEALDADDVALKEQMAGDEHPENTSADPQPAPVNGIDSAQHRRKAYARVIEDFTKRAIKAVLEAEETDLLESQEWQRRLLKRQRAQRLVWDVENPLALLKKEMPWAEHPKLVQPISNARQNGPKMAKATEQAAPVGLDRSADGEKRKRRRRRPRTTGLLDDDTSSSDDDDDDDESVPKIKAKSIAKKLVNTPERLIVAKKASGLQEENSDETSSDGSTSDTD